MNADDTSLIREYLTKRSSSSCFALVSRHQQSVFGMCYKILRNREEAEEAAQDVFIKCFDSLEKLKEPEKIKHWLLSVAYRTAIDYYRKRKPAMSDVVSIREPPSTEGENPDKRLEKMQSKALLQRVFDSMEKLDASILSLFYLEDMSVREIAKTLNQSESNIKIRLMRSRDYLRVKMESIYLKELKA
jgi:RNA polymerase sigma factor (sigma-70 family)